jgi:hypothetical protein
MPPMNRRDALKAVTALAGAALVTSTGALAGCGPEPRTARAPDASKPTGTTAARVLNADDETLAEAIADTLLPTTAASPGAKAAGAGPAMNLLLTDCYDAAAQQRVVKGLADFRATCRARAGREFTSLSPSEREKLLRGIDADAKKAGDAHYFKLVREVASRAYFSSEVGMTKALRYVQTPGKWVGCVPLERGQPAWG